MILSPGCTYFTATWTFRRREVQKRVHCLTDRDQVRRRAVAPPPRVEKPAGNMPYSKVTRRPGASNRLRTKHLARHRRSRRVAAACQRSNPTPPAQNLSTAGDEEFPTGLLDCVPGHAMRVRRRARARNEAVFITELGNARVYGQGPTNLLPVDVELSEVSLRRLIPHRHNVRALFVHRGREEGRASGRAGSVAPQWEEILRGMKRPSRISVCRGVT